MIREDLVAERIAVESYSEIVRDLGDNDPTSKRMLEEILAKEKEQMALSSGDKLGPC
jgi:bacterioferritin